MSSKDETAHKKQHKAMYNHQPTGTLDESLARWSRHFDKVLNVRREVTVDSAREPTDSSDALSVEVQRDEVTAALQKLNLHGKGSMK